MRARRGVLLYPSLLAGSLLAGALWFLPSNAGAVIPLPTYPDCGKDGTGAACPPDITRTDGTIAGDYWAYTNFIPAEVKDGIRKEEWDIGSGSSTTTAWQLSTGRVDVKVAVLDCGIRWREDTLINKVALNTGELPLPIWQTGSTCGKYDCDGNGLVNVQDYAYDPRVLVTAGRDEVDGRIDASDLIYTFADGVDGDGDGFIDNIAGWDFMWDDNDPYTTNDFYHMSSVLEEAAGEGGEQDSGIGHCPNCSILPVRVSDSFVGEGDKIAEAILYAVDHGANVIGMALGSMTNPEVLQSAMLYAWDHDVTIVAAAGDELGFHHNYPGANDHALYVHSIKYYPTISLETARTTLGFFGCNNFGARLDGVAASNACATGSVAATTGMVGLVYSRARDLGIELNASEVRQLMLRNVDDIDVPESQRKGSAYFPSHAGWDQFFGYGRMNVGRAVNRIGAKTIPPSIELTDPAWFEYVDPRIMPTVQITGRIEALRAASYGFTVEWAPGVDPAERDFTQLTSKTGLTLPTNGTLASLDVANIDPAKLDAAAATELLDGNDTMEERQEKLNRRSITLRIRATDSYGNLSEERKQFFVIKDADLLAGFPLYLGHSGEANPVLYDLNNDGKQEIIFPTSNGVLHVYNNLGKELTGWPVKLGYMPGEDPTNPKNHLKSPAFLSGQVSSDVRQGVIGAPAVGDLDNDGVAEIVVSTIMGKVYAYTADGKIKPGFPVSRDPVTDADTNPMIWLDPGMFAATVLYDLDEDGKLEIIQASMDQKVYVWRSTGARQAGWPVKVQNPDGSTGVTTVAGRIVSSPAVGDLDGDGSAEIVVGTNEYSDEKSFVGFAYALHGNGTLHSEGAVMAGWPIPIMGVLSGVINYIGEGVTPSPALADIDGDLQLEIILSGVGSQPKIVRYDGTEVLKLDMRGKDFGRDSNSSDNAWWSVVNNVAFGDFDGGGDIEVAMTGSGMSYFISLGLSRYYKVDHLFNVWKARSGKMLQAFPRVIEDISFFNAPAMADLTGDGLPELVAGTSGYILHAFKTDGTEPTGWPKFTGGWLIASPSVGDIDGDGLNEVVVPTREGYLFAWNTPGTGGLEWPQGRHDPQNTGNYEVKPEFSPRQALARVDDNGAASETFGCSTQGSSRLPLGALAFFSGLLSLLAIARRRS